MNRLCRFSLIMVSVFLLCSCGTMHSRVENLKSYTINTIHQANVGSTILSHKIATVTEGKRWVGVFNSKDGWDYVKEYSDDSFMEELIYTGRSGSTVHISYREYKRDFARPAFFQELRYDMSLSKIIIFKQYKIRIVEATNEYIRYVILTD